MIPLLVGLLAAPSPAGTAGLELGALAVRTPARHAIVGGLGLWATHAPRPWSVTGELAGTYRARGEDAFAFDTLLLRASAVASVAAGTRATTFHLGLGPALTARLGSVRWDNGEVPVRALEPGLRLRVALDGPLGERLGWSWRTGATTRGGGVDWDAALGLGVAW